MSHQSEIEKGKYRNWVRGGLAYKYLKQGLESFADDVVKQEQSRILSSLNCTPGTICNQCSFERLRPIHTCIKNSSGNDECFWGRYKCNCLHLKKKRCRLQVCDFIMEEILKSHGSTPPTPNWANTDIQKWCTEPWEVAKCFINAPGYSDKTKAADIDISGLLHVFINNTSLHSHLACSMGANNIFIKVRERRNKLFHSTTMEIEEGEVTECIDDIVEILEDQNELRGRPEAQEAVNKLKQLKESEFVITTNNEVDVCKEALLFVSQKSDELKQVIEDGKKEIGYVIEKDMAIAKDSIQKAQNDAVKELNDLSKTLYDPVKNVETDVPEKVEKLKTDFSERVGKVEADIFVLKSDVSSVEERVTSLERKVRELDSICDIYKRQLDYVKGKQELQVKLVNYYKKNYVRTSISPLKQQHDGINIKELYVTPEIEVIEEYQSSVDIGKNKAKNLGKRYIKGYHEIFHTKGQRHKKIYILGDVGTGKSTFCKMMIENWCNAVSGRPNESIRGEDDEETAETVSSDINMANECDDVSQMQEYEFLFFIPLQYMSVFKSDVITVMIKELTRDLTSYTELIDRIFQEDSRRCLIIADSLDEWTPYKEIVRKPHVSYGIPNGDLAQEATFITLSRPSAKGILNLKKSDIDLKLQLLGISSSSLKSFIERYISNTNLTGKTYNEFIKIMKTKQINHIEKTPLLLQQILSLYCNDKELGKSVSETYCQILNIMCGWLEHKNDGNDGRDCQNDAKEDKNIFLPDNLQQYPRLRTKNRILFLLGFTAFDILTSGSIRNIFGRQQLFEKELSIDDVTKLKQFGILNESNCFDPTHEDTQYSFTHMSYLEFFAALYVTSNDSKKETQCFGEKNDKIQKDLDKLFGTCKSASDILRLSNVIKMVCGLSPILIGDLSKRISCIMNEDSHILHLRRNGYKVTFRNDTIIQIQCLMVKCLKECGSFDKTLISISDLCINDIEPTPSLQRVNTDDVISLSFEETPNKNVVQYIKQCKYLQHIYIKYNSFTNIKELFFLSQQLSVKQITLHGVKVVELGIIDLSNQTQLQILELFSCEKISITNLPTEYLEQVYIKGCPNVLDLKLLSNASRLTELYIETHNYYNYDILKKSHRRHNIDMSTQNHLRNLTLINDPCIILTGLNVDQLEQAYIYDINNCVASGDMKLLSYESKRMELRVKNLTIRKATLLPLLQKTTLRKISLENVKCYQEKHLHIDLSGQTHLQKLTLVECPCIVITGLNTEQLEHVHIDNSNHYLRTYASIPALQFELPSSAKKLIELHLSGQTVHTKTLEILQQRTLRHLIMLHISGDQHDIHMNLSQLNHLQILKLSDCKNIKISGLSIEQLETVHIINCLCVFDFDISSNASKLSEIHLQSLTGNIASLVSLVEHASLRHLTLKGVTHCMPEVEGQTHEIHVDLSQQNHLQILELSDCKNIEIHGLNTEQLETVHIINCKCVFDFHFSPNARKLSEINLQSLTCNIESLISLEEQVSLKQLTLKGVTYCLSKVEGQTHKIHIDLSKHNHLQILELLDCNNIEIRGLNIDQLKQVHIDNCPYVFDFDILSNASKLSKIHLRSLIDNKASQVSLVERNSLRQLTLRGVTHGKSGVEGQTHKIQVNLSKQNYLQILELSDCKNIEISGLNIEQLKTVHIINCKCVFKFDVSSYASKLSKLHLQSFTGNIASLVSLVEHASLTQLTLIGVTHCQPNVEGQTPEILVDLSKQIHLRILELSDCKNIKISKLNTKQLEKLYVVNCPCVFDFDHSLNANDIREIHLQGHTGNIASLVSLVEHASLTQLTLIGVTHCQSDVEGQTHEIHVDLSKLNYLQTLELSDCKNIKIIELNTHELETVHIVNCSCVFDFDISLNASSLRKIHLQSFTGNIASLVSLVEQASIRQLTLIGVTHCKSDVEGQTHEIHVDLSKQNQLQILRLSDCQNMKISDINTEHLQLVHIEKCPGILNIELLANSRKLTELFFTGQVIGDNYQNRTQIGNVVHTLHQLIILELHRVDIDANALILTPEIGNLRFIQLENTNMSIDTWRAFVDSLRTLKQSVKVITKMCPSLCDTADQERKYQYVNDNPWFKLAKDDGVFCFCFQRREPE